MLSTGKIGLIDKIKHALLIASFFGIVFSITFILGFWVRISSLVLWVCLILVINSNELIFQLHYAYIAVALLTICLYNLQPLFSFKFDFFKNQMDAGTWQMVFSKMLFLTIFISGCSKFFVSEWRSGLASKVLCEMSPMIELGINYCGLDDYVFISLSYIVLFVEFSSILYFSKKFRFCVWCANLMLHFSMLLIIPVTNISTTMIAMQLFIFNQEFFKDDFLFRRIKRASAFDN